MEKLTERQQEMFDFVKEFTRSHGYPPTIREIQKNFGLRSTKGVKDHIDKLVAKGYLNRCNGSARAISISSEHSGEAVVNVPILGKVAAGLPLLATENVIGHYPVPDRTASVGERIHFSSGFQATAWWMQPFFQVIWFSFVNSHLSNRERLPSLSLERMLP